MGVRLSGFESDKPEPGAAGVGVGGIKAAFGRAAAQRQKCPRLAEDLPSSPSAWTAPAAAAAAEERDSTGGVAVPSALAAVVSGYDCPSCGLSLTDLGVTARARHVDSCLSSTLIDEDDDEEHEEDLLRRLSQSQNDDPPEETVAAAAACDPEATIEQLRAGADIDTQRYLDASAANSSVDPATFFGLPQEMRQELVREWKRSSSANKQQSRKLDGWLHSDGGGPSHKRRKPAQQSLFGMQQNTAKWSQLQQWAASDPGVGEVLRGMSKEEQLAMYDDLKRARRG